MTVGELNMKKIILNNDEAAEYLKVKASTLNNWRLQGKGPIYINTGNHILYDIKDLNDFLEENKFEPNDKLKIPKIEQGIKRIVDDAFSN